MPSIGTLRICGRSIPGLCQGKVAGESSKGEIQQPVRIGSPSGSDGRGDRLSSWFTDAVTATSNPRSKHHSSGEKQPAGAQTAFHPAAADGFHALGLTSPSTGRVDSTRPGNATSEGAGTAIRPPRHARCRATGGAFKQRTDHTQSIPGQRSILPRRRLSSAVTQRSILPCCSRSTRLRHAFRTQHSFDRPNESGHRCGNAQDATSLWYYQSSLHRCRRVATSRPAGIECATYFA